MLARTKVVLGSAVTYITLLSVVLQAVAAGLPESASLVARVLVVLGTVVAVIRRVTPALPEDRGLLAPTTPKFEDAAPVSRNRPLKAR